MASNFSWEPFSSGRTISRRYFQIPKDQHDLLDKESAWSENLSRGQHPMLNLPATVLQDLRDVHTRSHAEPSQQHSSPIVQPSILKPGKTKNPAPSAEENHDHEESDGSPISWSQSQAAVNEGEDEFEDEHDVEQPLQPEVRISSSKKQHRPVSPLPLSRSQPKRKRTPVAYEEQPQSSGAISESLEIVSPGFMSQVAEPPVNRAARQAIATGSVRPGTTPPSAQLPVGNRNTVTHPRPAMKRRKVMEEIQQSDNDPEPTEQAFVSKARPKPPHEHPNSNPNSLTTSISTPSFGSQPALGRRSQSNFPKAMSDPAAHTCSSLTPTWEGRPKERIARQVVITGTPIPGHSFVPPPAQRDPAGQSQFSSMRQSQQLAQTALARTPYAKFKAAYPDYSENVRKFVSACLSVNQLRRDRQLPEFMYDDYVRAHSSDYLLYISECSRKKVDKILPGIQWYNEHVSEMQYTKKLIRKDNLAAILDAHEKEAHSVRRSFNGDSQSTASESGVEESDEDMADASEDEEQEEREPQAIELESESASEGSPELHMDSPGPSQVRPLSEPRYGKTSGKVGKAPQGHTRSPTARDPPDDETMDDVLAEESLDEDVSVEVDRIGHSPSPGLHIDSPSAPKPTTTPNGSRTPEMRVTPASGKVRTLQKNDGSRGAVDPKDLFQPIDSSPPVPSRASDLRSHGHEQDLEATAISPHRKATTPSSTHSPRGHPVDEGDDEDDDEDAFEPLIPPPPLKKAARSSPAATTQPRPASTGAVRPPPASAAIAANKPFASSGEAAKLFPRRTSNISNLTGGPSNSPASSERSYANVPRTKKRLAETSEERSRNLKAFLKKRLSAGTPSSTSASRQ